MPVRPRSRAAPTHRRPAPGGAAGLRHRRLGGRPADHSTQAADLRARVGRPLELAGIAVRRPNRSRGGLDPSLFTTDAAGLVSRDDIDLVIEVIGGIEPARSLHPHRAASTARRW